MNRRKFIKKVAVGSIALASLPMVLNVLPASADEGEGGRTTYQFLDVSDGKGALNGKSIFMNGVGRVGSGVTGGGDYSIFDNTTGLGSFDFGSWRAKKLVSLTNVGTVVGGFLGATMTMDVELESANGKGEAAATLKVNCDMGVSSPNGGDGSGDVITLAIKNGPFAGTFGPGSAFPFNVTIFIAPSE